MHTDDLSTHSLQPAPTPLSTGSSARVERDLARSCLGLIDSLANLRLLLGIPRGMEAPELLAQAMRVLLRSHEVTRCSVFVLRAGLLECAAGASLGDAGAGRGDDTGPIGEPQVFRLGEGVMGHAALERLTVCVGDVRRDPRFLPIPSSPRPPRALVSVPLVAGPRVLGVLNVSHPDVRCWSGWQQQVFELYGQVIAERLQYARPPGTSPPPLT